MTDQKCAGAPLRYHRRDTEGARWDVRQDDAEALRCLGSGETLAVSRGANLAKGDGGDDE